MGRLINNEAICACCNSKTLESISICETREHTSDAPARLRAASRLVEDAAKCLAGEIDRSIVADLFLKASALDEVSKRVDRLTNQEPVESS